jgi:cytochrome c peroxidase
MAIAIGYFCHALITQPIQVHLEMGFSGTEGDPNLGVLLSKLEAIDYYQELFTFVFGDSVVTEARLQDAMSQFIRSIRSFDSRFDEGRLTAPDNLAPFANFTAQGILMELKLTTEERQAVKAFLQTLAGEAIFTDPKWSDPFSAPE